MPPVSINRVIGPVETVADGEYATVAASQTAQALGAGGGAAGDALYALIISPAATTAGVVTLLDGSTSIAIWIGTAAGITDLKPFSVDMRGILSKNGPWKVTTGVGVTVIAVGKFT